MDEIKRKALEVLANHWQDEAAGSWGETKEHATLQRCADELRALLATAALRSAQVQQEAVGEVFGPKGLSTMVALSRPLPPGTKLYTHPAAGDKVRELAGVRDTLIDDHARLHGKAWTQE